MAQKLLELYVTTLGFYVFLLLDKCSLAVINATHQVKDSPEENLSFLTECELWNQTGYCVLVQNCKVPIDANSPSRNVCGPSNAERTKPKICCERTLIQVYQKQITFNNVSKHCGIQIYTSANRIKGGEDASQGEFPWLSRLLRRDYSGEFVFSCTGALISSKAVLTTAHCLASTELDTIGTLDAVSLGERETTCTYTQNCLIHKKTVVVDRYVVHPGYDRNSDNHDNDIGLIILRDRVHFTPHISPICLLTQEFQVNEYHVSGWGKTENSSESSVKLKTSLPPFSWQQCAEKYRSINVQLTPRQICAGGSEKDSCQGDSGGPLMVQNQTRWFVAGVVSFGLGCGKPGWPGIYTRVPSYIEWIMTNMPKEY